MSEIPFVNQLGDAIEVAIARPAPSHRPRLGRLTRRRWLAVALAALVVAGGGAAIAGMLHDPVEIGFGAVGCFERTEPSGNVAIVTDPTKLPVELCAAALPNDGLDAGDLIACSWEGHGIVVLARGDRGSCRERGLAPVPAAYGLARRRSVRLQRLVIAFERRVDCLAPRPFAERLQVLVRERGFAGWRAVVRGGAGPCGRVSSMGGTATRSIAGWVDGSNRTIAVRGAAPLALERALYGTDSPGDRLFRASGARCFTLPELKAEVRRELAGAGYAIRFRVHSMDENQGMSGARGRRYREGCAISTRSRQRRPSGRPTRGPRATSSAMPACACRPRRRSSPGRGCRRTRGRA